MPQPTREAIGRTRAFARVVGPFLVAVTLIIAIRLPDLTGLVNDLFSNSVLPWMLGAMMFACGLVVIAFHQYWYSLPAIVISVFGWFVALRGLTLMAFPDDDRDRRLGDTRQPRSAARRAGLLPTAHRHRRVAHLCRVGVTEGRGACG